jgi:hypothetical protein
VASETEQELRRYLEGVDFAANTEDLNVWCEIGSPFQ